MAILKFSILLLLYLCGSQLYGQSWTRKEAGVRAALLLNIVRFTKYPDKSNNFYFCVMGKNPFEGVIDIIEKQNLDGLKVVFRELERSDESVSDCSLAFLSEDTKSDYDDILPSLGKHPILTASSMKKFADNGGMVEIFLTGTKLKFRINLKEVQKANLKISSRVLQLATDVIQ